MFYCHLIEPNISIIHVFYLNILAFRRWHAPASVPRAFVSGWCYYGNQRLSRDSSAAGERSSTDTYYVTYPWFSAEVVQFPHVFAVMNLSLTEFVN